MSQENPFDPASILNKQNPKIIITQSNVFETQNDSSQTDIVDIAPSENQVEGKITNEQVVIYVDLNTNLKKPLTIDESRRESRDEEIRAEHDLEKVETKPEPDFTVSDDHMKSISTVSTNEAFMCEAYDSSDSKRSSVEEPSAPITEVKDFEEAEVKNKLAEILEKNGPVPENQFKTDITVNYVMLETTFNKAPSEVQSSIIVQPDIQVPAPKEKLPPIAEKKKSEIIADISGIEPEVKPGILKPETELKPVVAAPLPLWMEKPAAPLDCPSGLEYLLALNHIIVQQNGYVDTRRDDHGRTSFLIKNPDGQNIYSILSKTSTKCLPVFFCASRKQYQVKVYDINKQEVVYISRTKNGNRRTVNIFHSFAGPFGKVIETSKTPSIFHVVDQNNKAMYIIEKLNNPPENDRYFFNITSVDGSIPVGKITMRTTNSLKRMSHTNLHHVFFAEHLNVRSKTLLMGASMLIDFIYFEFM